uniref:DUF4939 domain-containing protein n=1 Tax=Cyprinodon variegatus TaxID=28743 RepID=A0A3Q2E1Z9_CYPVA
MYKMLVSGAVPPSSSSQLQVSLGYQPPLFPADEREISVRSNSPGSFPTDKKKITLILSQLTGRALEWAEARFTSESSFRFLVDFLP